MEDYEYFIMKIEKYCYKKKLVLYIYVVKFKSIR